MRLALISDTHMGHEQLVMPEVDVLVHAGDFSRRGRVPEAEAFLDWLGGQKARHKVLVAGNHDFQVEERGGWFREQCRARRITYLEDEGAVVDGVSFWGSPVTPRFGDMAFNRDRGAAIRTHWEKIPPEVDVLVTHGPPAGILDRTFLGMKVGCADLLEAITARKVKLHVFGHIHEAHGVHQVGDTTFLNVASRSLLPGGLRPVVVRELP